MAKRGALRVDAALVGLGLLLNLAEADLHALHLALGALDGEDIFLDLSVGLEEGLVGAVLNTLHAAALGALLSDAELLLAVAAVADSHLVDELLAEVAQLLCRLRALLLHHLGVVQLVRLDLAAALLDLALLNAELLSDGAHLLAEGDDLRLEDLLAGPLLREVLLDRHELRLVGLELHDGELQLVLLRLHVLVGDLQEPLDGGHVAHNVVALAVDASDVHLKLRDAAVEVELLLAAAVDRGLLLVRELVSRRAEAVHLLLQVLVLVLYLAEHAVSLRELVLHRVRVLQHLADGVLELGRGEALGLGLGLVLVEVVAEHVELLSSLAELKGQRLNLIAHAIDNLKLLRVEAGRGRRRGLNDDGRRDGGGGGGELRPHTAIDDGEGAIVAVHRATHVGAGAEGEGLLIAPLLLLLLLHISVHVSAHHAVIVHHAVVVHVIVALLGRVVVGLLAEDVDVEAHVGVRSGAALGRLRDDNVPAALLANADDHTLKALHVAGDGDVVGRHREGVGLLLIFVALELGAKLADLLPRRAAGDDPRGVADLHLVVDEQDAFLLALRHVADHNVALGLERRAVHGDGEVGTELDSFIL